MGVNLIAALWGLAEATLFFLVPDIWLSIVGRKNLRVGMIACLYSLPGALLGGVIMYSWGAYDPASVLKVLDYVPAISQPMLGNVSQQLNEQGLMAIMFGPLSGIPYKTFAAQAAEAGVGLVAFMLISIPARLIRFVLVTTLCHYALKGISRFTGKPDGLGILITGWLLLYLFYFYVMGL